MATPANHLDQWRHNRRLVAQIPRAFPDWIVTVTFYAALHIVDALLASDTVRGITSHDARNRVLQTTNRYNFIWLRYGQLYMLSRTVRYLAEPTKWVSVEDIQSKVFPRYLYPIEQSVEKLLGYVVERLPITVVST